MGFTKATAASLAAVLFATIASIVWMVPLGNANVTRGRAATTTLLLSSSTAKRRAVFPTTNKPNKPLQVFILAGQSNMQGQGFVDETDDDGNFKNGTLEWMVETFPEEYGHLKTGKNWTVSENVYIAYNDQGRAIRPEWNHVGKLTAGFGSGAQRIGPELGFGYAVGQAFLEEETTIVLLKIAWGGKSLAVDFRPPSSQGSTGLYYEAMLADIYQGLSRLDRLFPEAAAAGTAGYEIKGFGWHQGWNDGCDASMVDEYESNLANLVRDVRQDLDVPDLPFTIGVSGMCGWTPEDPIRNDLAQAQLAVAQRDEFKDTVTTVETRSFFRTVDESPGTQIYHWNNNCESYWLIGEAMGDAMLDLLRIQNKNNSNHNTTSNNAKGHSFAPFRFEKTPILPSSKE